MILGEMAQTGLFEKVRKSYLKDVDRGLRACWGNTEKRTRDIKARTSKAESEAFEAKQKKIT